MMIAIAKPKTVKITSKAEREAHAKFCELAPGISNYVRKTFRKRDPNSLDEIEQSVLVFSFETIRSLAAKGRLNDAYATVLARYGIRKHLTGRIGGIPSSSTDVLGERCRFLNRAKVEHYGLCENISDSFESEATANDGKYPIHRTVALKIDFFDTWLAKQTSKDQAIIQDLAMGYTTTEVAKAHNISMGRVSQLRKTYAESWYAFIEPKVDEIDFIDELKKLASKESV